MTFLDVTEVLAWFGFTLGFFASLPQVLKTLRTKDVSSLAVWTYIILLTKEVCYIVRAWSIGETVWLVSNLWAFVSVGTVFVLILMYRK